MKSKRIKGLIGLSLTTLLVLAACGGDGGAGAEKAKGGSEKTAAKQEFKVVVQQEMPSADLSLGKASRNQQGLKKKCKSVMMV